MASSRTEADLAKHDKYHVCNPSALSQAALNRARDTTLTIYGLEELRQVA